MQFKRNESFRLAFDPPIDVTFKILSGQQTSEGRQVPSFGKILDISPGGMKLFSDVQFGDTFIKYSQVEMNFVLDTQNIHVFGDVIWRKSYGAGFNYGVLFANEGPLEELIISELKSRRKKEVEEAKKSRNHI